MEMVKWTGIFFPEVGREVVRKYLGFYGFMGVFEVFFWGGVGGCFKCFFSRE